MRSWANWKNMIIITEQVYETTRENISNRLITIITIIKKNILKDDKSLSLVVRLNLYFFVFYIIFNTNHNFFVTWNIHIYFIVFLVCFILGVILWVIIIVILFLFIFKFIFCFCFPLICSIWLLSFIFFLFDIFDEM